MAQYTITTNANQERILALALTSENRRRQLQQEPLLADHQALIIDVLRNTLQDLRVRVDREKQADFTDKYNRLTTTQQNQVDVILDTAPNV